jgi:arsenate reductase-like glutaredoxin family protein
VADDKSLLSRKRTAGFLKNMYNYHNVEKALCARGLVAMNIQIIGTKKCRDTQKAERYFKERRIPYHFVDLTERGLSKGELDKIKVAAGAEALLNRDSKEYSRLNMQYIVHNRDEMLLQHPLLLRTPIVRNGAKATVGYCPEVWQGWE